MPYVRARPFLLRLDVCTLDRLHKLYYCSSGILLILCSQRNRTCSAISGDRPQIVQFPSSFHKRDRADLASTFTSARLAMDSHPPDLFRPDSCCKPGLVFGQLTPHAYSGKASILHKSVSIKPWARYPPGVTIYRQTITFVEVLVAFPH